MTESFVDRKLFSQKFQRCPQFSLSQISIEMGPNNSPPKAEEKPRARAGASPSAGKKKKHPTYQVMVTKALEALQERKGATKDAIFKYIMANYLLELDESTVSSFSAFI